VPVSVELLEVMSLPNGGGLKARARLGFATGVRGPLLLGRDSHRGGGLFSACAEGALTLPRVESLGKTFEPVKRTAVVI
jgi:hypothetical protein